MTRARLLLPALLAITACAQQVGSTVAPAAPGFLLGLWHGFIFPVAWGLSLLWWWQQSPYGRQMASL